MNQKQWLGHQNGWATHVGSMVAGFLVGLALPFAILSRAQKQGRKAIHVLIHTICVNVLEWL